MEQTLGWARDPLAQHAPCYTADMERAPRFALQMAHLTVPATRWAMVERAVTLAPAPLVMLDLEDSLPRADDRALELGRAQVVRALLDLAWGDKLRFFRPRGLDLDPGLEDLNFVLPRARERLEGIVIPKVENADEVRRYDRALGEIERREGLAHGGVRISVLIESVSAEEQAFEIARASSRVVSLVFGAFDYWSSLGMALAPYRFDHPAVDAARLRIVKAAASIGVPAIAEMSTSFPTKDKTEDERAESLRECVRDAEHARDLGMLGKWVGHPAQIEPVLATFTPSTALIERAIRGARAFKEAELGGVGAVMIDGRMADRATDRLLRCTLAMAKSRGLLDPAIARELSI